MLKPGPKGAGLVASAAHDSGDLKRCYQVALQAVHALPPDSSSFVACALNMYLISAIRGGALGPTWSWSQLQPFVANIRTAGRRLKRWMVPVVWEKMMQDNLKTYATLERSLRHQPQL